MVKKVKRFIVFVLFSFFYSLLSGKTAEAARSSEIILIPKSADNKMIYNGAATNISTHELDDKIGY